MRVLLKLHSKEFVNTNPPCTNDWKHQLIVIPLDKDDDDTTTDSESTATDITESTAISEDETVLELDEHANKCVVIYGFYENKFDPPTEIFYNIKEVQAEFLNNYVESVLKISEEYLCADRTIKTMIDVKDSETILTMYEFTPSYGYEIPEKGHRWVMKILIKGVDY